MTVNYRSLSQAVPGAADMGQIRPTDEEMAVFNTASLIAWVRASINYDQMRVVDRARGVSFNKITRSPMMPRSVGTGGKYNDLMYFSFPDEAEVNPPELRSGEDILPAAGSYTFAFVGHWKAGARSRYYFFGNDASTSALTFAIGMNLSSGRLEVKHSDNTFWNTGAGAFTPPSDVPMLVIVGYDISAGRLRVRFNRGSADQNRTGVTGNIGSARKLQVGASGGDSFGRANPLFNGGIAEFMVFDAYILDDTQLVAQVEKILGDRYGFAAP